MRILLLVLCLSGVWFSSYAGPVERKETPIDSTYISDHSKELTVRLYGSRKFTGYILGEYGNRQRLKYRPNDNFNSGVGFTYKYVGINLGFRLPFINDDNKKYGKTRFLDLQSYVYSRKITADLYAQFYNGYYIANRSVLQDRAAYGSLFPQRSDIKTKNVGLNMQYIFNHRRFSYRAAYLQNEYQKRSAGSLVAGGGLHYISINADSAIIPLNLIYPDFFKRADFNRSHIFCLALNVGYAYTLVVKQHYFLTGSLSVGTGVNYTSITNTRLDVTDKNLGTQLNGIFRLSTGYNSERYFAGVAYVNFVTRNTSPITDAWQEFQTGNFRLYFAKRFKLKKKVQKMIPLP